MVVAALGALAGAGLQWYGADKRQAAMDRAQIAYDQWLNSINARQGADDKQMQALMAALGENYAGSQTSLAGQFNPDDRLAAFGGGRDQSNANIQQVLAQMGGMQAHPNLPTGGEAGVFATAAGNEQASNDAARARLMSVVSQGAGLNAMENRDSQNVFSFSDNAKVLQNKIAQAQRLYGFGQSLRNQALARAGNRLSSDMRDASTVGNTEMMVGGLLGAGAQAYGSYKANQPAGGGSGLGTSGASDLGGGSGSGVNFYDPSFTGARQA